VALAQIGAVSAVVSVPVVAMGGISTGRDAAEMIRAGAEIVAVGTESFRDPATASRIAASSPMSWSRSPVNPAFFSQTAQYPFRSA
jgi:dihydroorotate dehydrogenase (NAD+) catalytic subunit